MGGVGAIAPPPLGGPKKILRKNKQTKNGPFENEVDEIRGHFKNGHRLISETCNFCRILLHVDDQA